MKPNFIIIGTMKGGTTSLYHYLSSHPKISGSKTKETNFFRPEKDFEKRQDWYNSLFNSKFNFSFEASPDYTKKHIYPGVPKRIHSLLPNVKLIYILRDPIKRILSHYTHNIAFGSEKRSMSEFIKTISHDDNYLNTSRYFYQLEEFLKFFPQNQIMILESEKLKKYPEDEVNKLLNFVGISERYTSSILKQKFHDSSTKKHWSPLERKFNNIITYPPLRKFLKTSTNSFRKPLDIPKITDSEISVLKEKLSQDVHKLRMFTGIPFEEWSL